jgi:hypothetical protein
VYIFCEYPVTVITVTKAPEAKHPASLAQPLFGGAITPEMVHALGFEPIPERARSPPSRRECVKRRNKPVLHFKKNFGIIFAYFFSSKRIRAENAQRFAGAASSFK